MLSVYRYSSLAFQLWNKNSLSSEVKVCITRHSISLFQACFVNFKLNFKLWWWHNLVQSKKKKRAMGVFLYLTPTIPGVVMFV